MESETEAHKVENLRGMCIYVGEVRIKSYIRGYLVAKKWHFSLHKIYNIENFFKVCLR